MVQELRNTQFLTVTQIHVLGYRTHDINHLHLLVELQPLLTVVTETNGLAHVKMPAVWSDLSHKHLDESRLTRTVVTDNTHFLITGENVIEVVCYLQVAKTLAHVRGLKDLGTDI